MRRSSFVGRSAVAVAAVLVLGLLPAALAPAAQGGPWIGFDGCNFNGLNSNTQHVAQTWESGTNCGGTTVFVRIRYETLNGSILSTAWYSDASAVVKTVSSTYTILSSDHRMCRTGTTSCAGTRTLSA